MIGRQRQKKEKGLSLIEVCLSLAVLVLVLGGLIGIFAEGHSISAKVKARTIVHNLLKEKLEELYITAAAFFTTPDVYDEARAAVAGFTGFEREVNVTSPYLGRTQLAHIQVTVWWDNGTQSQTVETIKANY